MDTGLHRMETGRLAASGGQLLVLAPGGRHPRANSRSKYLAVGVVSLLAVLTAGAAFTLAKWSPPSGSAGTQRIRLVTAAVAAPEPAPATAVSPTPDDASLYPDTAPREVEVAVVTDGLTISSQRWQRGGLGSNALVTFTLRNGNDYAVKDIEISCAFSRRDGSHLTDRTRVVHDTVKMRGRKSFAHWHIGFVNVNADRAKCTPVSATRI
jgi:hypothetical protein